ncbi:MAG TPA: DUF4097 family beta strand repeat-containing protein [Steroidobacteraceae bacterium]|jgi:DUF4097 and DUF4098 domain-containing protein YvlB|nr:DUF4097 family beta strand repeat-containing protein [Steroidobacteraceae bacterium]
MRSVLTLSAALLVLGAGTSTSAAGRDFSKSFDKSVPAEASGTVEISNVAGSIEVTGSDRAEVTVHAEMQADVERVDVTSDHGRTVVKVVLPNHSNNCACEAHLRVQVPKGSELNVSAVSADLRLTGVSGAQRLNSVSGDTSTEIFGADLELKSVSGDVKVRGHGQPARLHVSTVSGDVHLEHGAGDLEAGSVSGSLVLTLDAAHSVRTRTTSGDLRFEGKLTRGGSFDASTVSGDLNVRASADGGYAYEVSTFSGDISDCFDVRPNKPGPVGESLSGARGEGAGHVRLKTMSGDVQLCDRT